jgi:molybdopterin synthase sulfur carrier subunit
VQLLNRIRRVRLIRQIRLIRFGSCGIRLILAISQSMSVTIEVPGPLRDAIDGARGVAIEASSVRGALDELERRYPRLHRGICFETGDVRPHVGVFVGMDHIRDRDGLDTPLMSGDVITILPAVSGG